MRRLLEMLDAVCFIHAYLSKFNRKMIHVKNPKNLHNPLYIIITGMLRS